MYIRYLAAAPMASLRRFCLVIPLHQQSAWQSATNDRLPVFDRIRIQRFHYTTMFALPFNKGTNHCYTTCLTCKYNFKRSVTQSMPQFTLSFICLQDVQQAMDTQLSSLAKRERGWMLDRCIALESQGRVQTYMVFMFFVLIFVSMFTSRWTYSTLLLYLSVIIVASFLGWRHKNLLTGIWFSIFGARLHGSA
ncbi:uncharacterized protein B0T23DRAFT_107564 [Neurospora hispaniola]|uniref:Uncharacterized protein n=1 Tax=Neurospora hispaniola TaxID=588809 RepID=A0AAJ0I9D3_9PEZI|nr:hypothetical protein B0T23DRAFT_107564 [Neurospora hispaniola]